MKIHHLSIPTSMVFLLFGSIFTGFSQSKSTPFSSEDLSRFASIYIETQKMGNSIDVEIISLLQEYNVSYGRYKEILTKKIEGIETTSFSDNELKFFEAIKLKNDSLTSRVESLEKLRCQEMKMEPEIYFTIKKEFLASPSFQNHVYPYFEKVLSQDDQD
ncbi:MAG: hypothetical protein WAT79_02800 [Saprospiraceae bacterium]